MENQEFKPETIDAYINQYPPDIQERLRLMKRLILSECSDAQETISYGMPTFKYFGNLVHFAACKSHIGFYPGAAGVVEHFEELKEYKQGKGSVQFPFIKPIPEEIVKSIVRYRMGMNRERKREK